MKSVNPLWVQFLFDQNMTTAGTNHFTYHHGNLDLKMNSDFRRENSTVKVLENIQFSHNNCKKVSRGEYR